jgi:SpoIID/LytB domain protein
MPRPDPSTRRPHLAPATALLGVALGASLAIAPLSPAAAADSWSVPRSATVVIKGHGYGHGHGLSQYGAEGAARAGLTYEQIAEFYYPGTTWGSAGGRVRVLITADTSDDLVVRSRKRLQVKDLATGQRAALPDNGATRWRLKAGTGTTTVVSYRTTRWRRWTVLAGDAEFSAGGRPIKLLLPNGASRIYRGRLRSASPTPGRRARDTVNVLPLDAYLRGVVPLEMPALWSPDAVRAQAVAARTYAAYERAHPRTSYYQICDTSACQVYGGYQAEHPAADAAVAATARRVLTDADGAPAFTQFSSSSGGWTAAGSVPYLTAQEDPYDGWSGNPVHDWTIRLPDTAIEQKLPAIGNLRRITVTQRDGNGDWGGRVESVTFVGGKGKRTLSGDAARSLLGLRSTWFTFRIR